MSKINYYARDVIAEFDSVCQEEYCCKDDIEGAIKRFKNGDIHLEKFIEILENLSEN